MDLPWLRHRRKSQVVKEPESKSRESKSQESRVESQVSSHGDLGLTRGEEEK